VRLHEVRPLLQADRSEYAASLHADPPEPVAPPCGEDRSAHAAAAAAALVAGALCAFVDGIRRPRWIAIDLDRAQWVVGETCGLDSPTWEESS
jgi:hypothetical protein